MNAIELRLGIELALTADVRTAGERDQVLDDVRSVLEGEPPGMLRSELVGIVAERLRLTDRLIEAAIRG